MQQSFRSRSSARILRDNSHSVLPYCLRPTLLPTWIQLQLLIPFILDIRSEDSSRFTLVVIWSSVLSCTVATQFIWRGKNRG